MKCNCRQKCFLMSKIAIPFLSLKNILITAIILVFLCALYPIFRGYWGIDFGHSIDILRNYFGLNSNLESLLTALKFTLIYVFFTVLGQLTLGLICTYYAFFSSKRLYLIILFFIPYCIPLFLSTLSTRLLFESNGIGTIISNSLFTNEVYPLSNDAYSFTLLVLLSIWQYYPFVFLFLFTMTLRINNNYIISGVLDGASNLTLFRSLILPNIKKIIIPLVCLRILFMFNKYDLVVLFAKTERPTNMKSLFIIPVYLRDIFISNTDMIYSLGVGIFILLLLISTLVYILLNALIK